MPINRKFKPLTIKTFKGMNTGFLGSTPEAYSQDDEELADITNFQVTPDGYLEKRAGASVLATISGATGTQTQARVLFLQRTRVGALANRIFATDGARVWRVDAVNSSVTHLTVGGQIMQGLYSITEYGGAAAAESYNCFGVRFLDSVSDPVASGGICLLYGDSTANTASWYPNTPMGTQILDFKNRGWVINAFGGQYTNGQWRGHETRVWYSETGHFENFGGAGAPNNFNLDFGDGDFCTAMVSFNDSLIIFKTRKTFILSADGSPTDWQYRLVSDRIGCVGAGTVKVVNGVIYFLSMDGVMRTDGTTFQNISLPIQDYLDQYRNYVDPQTVVNLYASYWGNKYILWLPDAVRNTCDTALVFDLRTEAWSKWVLAGGVTALGECTWDEHYPDTLFIGSWRGNRIWMFGGSSIWVDNSTMFDCSFTTKKYDAGRTMGMKRNHLVGLSVMDNSISQGMYEIDVTANDNTVTTRVEAPSKTAVMNIKAKGAGYGRYFQTVVTQRSTNYAAVYDLTMMNEERGYEHRSMPTPVAPLPNQIFNMGPDTQDKLDNGMKMG